jgi:hypothetical protein
VGFTGAEWSSSSEELELNALALAPTSGLSTPLKKLKLSFNHLSAL